MFTAGIGIFPILTGLAFLSPLLILAILRWPVLNTPAQVEVFE